ncbi:hypothetical protein MMC25_004067 [Agyrium rufum]|nr:hypothetical protein [Agyrium rufum]
MPQGGCLCGDVRISYDGEPAMQATCHCADCRKITGSTYSTNVIIPGPAFSLVSGSPSQFKKTADSGKEITSHFCSKCGSTLWRDGASFGDAKVVKVGVMDDKSIVDAAKPAAELFSGGRINWVAKTEGAGQLDGMPPS